MEVEDPELLVLEASDLPVDMTDILCFDRTLGTDQDQVAHLRAIRILDEEVSDALDQVALEEVYIDHNHYLGHHHILDNVEEVVAEDNCYLQEGHIVHGDSLEVHLQVQEVVEDSLLEMVEDNNQMREVDHKEDIQDLGRIHSLGLREVGHSHAVAGRSSLAVVAKDERFYIRQKYIHQSNNEHIYHLLITYLLYLPALLVEVAGVARQVVLEVAHQAVQVVVHLADQAQMEAHRAVLVVVPRAVQVEVHRVDLAVVPLAGLVVVHGL